MTGGGTMACPYCGRPMRKRDDTGKAPVAGDMAYCLGCKKLGIFTMSPLGLALRLPSAEEQDRLRVFLQSKLAEAARSGGGAVEAADIRKLLVTDLQRKV